MAQNGDEERREAAIAAHRLHVAQEAARRIPGLKGYDRDDSVQGALLLLYDREQLKPVPNADRFLTRTVRNLAKNRHREQSRERDRFSEVGLDSLAVPDPGTGVDEGDLRDLSERMPAELRSWLVCFCSKATDAEIAKVWVVTEATARWWRARVCAWLREQA